MSVAGVSRALRHEGRMSRDTCIRVKKIAEEMGYFPNPLLAAIASRKFKHQESRKGEPLLYLAISPESAVWDESFQNYKAAFEEHAARLGYRLVPRRINRVSQIPSILNSAWKMGVQGILLGDILVDQINLVEEWKRFSIVSCRTIPDGLSCYSVQRNHFEIILDAYRRLSDAGYRRIGVALKCHTPTILHDSIRLSAVRLLQGNGGLKSIMAHPYLYSDLSGDELYTWINHEKLDAVIGFQIDSYSVLFRRYPSMLSNLGFISLHLSNDSWSDPIAGYLYGTSSLTQAAVEWIDRMIRHGHRGFPETPSKLLIFPPWKDGPSLKNTGASARTRT